MCKITLSGAYKAVAEIALCLLIAVAPRILIAQATSGTIVGIVHDSSGAIVPGAHIVATSQDTGIAHKLDSDSKGLYTIPELPMGTYFVEFTASGFAKVKVGPVKLSSAQQVEVNVTVSPGAVEQSVNVNAEGQLLQTQESAVKSEISQTQIENLPLNGRSPTELVLLGPSTSLSGQSVGGSLGFTINGQNNTGSSLRLDGIDNSIGTDTGFLFGSLAFNLNTTSVDAIAEFDIQTSNYTADSKGSSGYINVITKSGTNTLHYDFYDYFRNGAMDATPYFSTTGRGSLKQNDFGGTALGPIKRNKAFFMVSYEGQRIHLPYPGFAVVPTQAFRATVDPRLAPFLAATPLPTSPIAGNAAVGNYQRTVESTTRQDLGTVRVDYAFSPNDRIFGRYVINDGAVTGAQSVTTGTTGNGLSIFPGYGFAQTSRHQTAIMDWTHVFSSRLVNDLKFGGNRYFEQRLRGDPSIFSLPAITIPGVIVSGGGNRKRWGTSEGEVNEKGTWTNGKSTLSFGGNYSYWVSGLNQFSVAVLAFPNLTTFASDSPTSISSGLGFAQAEPSEHIRNGQKALFVQEDYRLSPQLTLNFGLRYDNFGIMADSTNHALNVVSGPFSAFRAPGAPLYNGNNHDFSPRFGFAWEPIASKPLVLRGGVGIYYGGRTTGEAGDIFIYNSVGSYNVTSVQFPALAYPLSPALASFAAATPGRHILDPDSKDLSTQQWNLTTQYQFGRSTALSVGYVGNHQIHMPGETLPNVFNPLLGRVNNPAFGSVALIQTIDTAYYNSMQVTFRHNLSHNIAWDTYYTWSHAMGLETSVLEGSAAVGGGHEQVQTYTNRNLNRYNMPFDARHQFTHDFTYQLPRLSDSNPLVRNALGGWTTSGIVKMSSGLPFIVTTGGDTGDGTNQQRPNLVSGVPIYTGKSPFVGMLNRAAFAVPTAVDPATGLKLGYLLNNYVHRPMYLAMDWAVAKNLYKNDKFSADFRGELFNILNHPVFSAPVSQMTAPNFGQSQTTGDPREIQLMLRFSF